MLGNELRLILIRIMEILNKARANVQGVALPLVDSNLKPLNFIFNYDFLFIAKINYNSKKREC